jgi:hypothetical protein
VTVVARRRLALVVGVVAFVLISLAVARWLDADSSERAQVEDLLAAQAAGDVGAMALALERCDTPCAQDLAALAARFADQGTGDVEIVRYDSPTSHALGAETGKTRVVWQRKGLLPTVQCVTVKRTGNPVTGPTVTLTRLSAPIAREGSC